MDFFQSSYYRVNRYFLFCLGQWPFQTRKERYILRLTTILLVGSIMVPKFIKFAECLGDMNAMIQCLPVLGLHALSTAKFANYIFNANKMKQLANKIQEDWNVRVSSDEISILRRYAGRGRLLTITYACYLFATLYMYLLLPGIPIVLDVFAPLNESRQRVFLYETEYFVDQNEYYFLILIHAYITMPFSVGMIVAYDTMFAVYVHHVCAIFATIGARLENVGRSNADNSPQIERDSVVSHSNKHYDEIVTCVKIHKEALKFATLIESSGSVCFLFVIGIGMLMITLTGFMTVTNLNDPSEALRFGAFALGEVIHLFYLCWQGQLLMEHSEHIFTNAYNADWYDISIRGKRLLILIMMRSSEPCRITAGKIYVLSLQNFTTALKTSMSYFTVLLSVQ